MIEDDDEVIPPITAEDLMEMGPQLRGMVYDALTDREKHYIAKKMGYPKWAMIPSRRDTDED